MISATWPAASETPPVVHGLGVRCLTTIMFMGIIDEFMGSSPGSIDQAETVLDSSPR